MKENIKLRNRVVDKDLIFEEGTHTYTYKGKVLKSITTLLSEMGVSPDYSNVDNEILEKRKERGIDIHARIETYIKSGKVDENDKVVNNFIKYLKAKELTVIDSEYIVFNADDGLAGKVDLLLEDKEGNIIITDIKTTSVIHYDSVSWQLSLYDYLGEEHASKGLCIYVDKEDRVFGKDILLKPQDSVFQVVFTRKCPIVKVDEAVITKVFQVLVSIDNLKQQLKEQQEFIDNFNKELIESMESNGVKRFENDNLIITYVAPFDKETIDSKALKKELPDIAEKYTKKTTTKASVRITIKGEENED